MVFLPQVSLLIRRELFERAKDFNIILDDVAITDLSFSREYTAAVEAKQVGESLSLVLKTWSPWFFTQTPMKVQDDFTPLVSLVYQRIRGEEQKLLKGLNPHLQVLRPTEPDFLWPRSISAYRTTELDQTSPHLVPTSLRTLLAVSLCR